MIEMIDDKYYNRYHEQTCGHKNEHMIVKSNCWMIGQKNDQVNEHMIDNNDNNTRNGRCCERYPSQLGTPEEEDCSSAVVPDILEPNNGKRKVLVSDPVSMTKYLFDNYRLDMFSYLNRIRRNGTLSRIIGRRVLNDVFTRQQVNFLNVTYWRIDRENFWADVSVELKLHTDEGPFEWRGVIEVLCSFYEQFEFSIEGLSSERVSTNGQPTNGLSTKGLSTNGLSNKGLSPTVDRNGFDLSSTFLVPYFTNRRMDEIAEKMWEKYIPEALTNPKARSAVELAKRMGLCIEYHNIFDHHGVKGIIFFTAGELIVGDDRYEEDEDGNRHLVKTREPKAVKIPANTIVVNTNNVKRNYSAFTVFHECIHYEFHYLFFRLQQMGNNDPRKMKSKEVIVDKDEEVKDEMVFIERQANRGAYGLMMPASHTKELINSGCAKVQEFRHQGDKYEEVGIELGKMLSLPDFHIRARMIQLGYRQTLKTQKEPE